MHIVAEVNIIAPNFQAMRADHFKAAADCGELRRKPPTRVKPADEIDKQTHGIRLVVTTHGVLQPLHRLL